MLDTQSLLQPIAAEAPGGPNLEYSPEYTEFERALVGKPERQVGEVSVPAEDPDWRALIEKATALLRASKDLRVATHLAHALLRREAFAGLAQGLAVVHGLVESYWPVLHPRLEEEDNDPTARINAMATLTHRDMLLAVRTAPLVASKAFGVVTLRDVEATLVRGRDGSAGGGIPPEAALQGMPMNELAEAARAIEACDAQARALQVLWETHLDAGGPDFTDLRRVLSQAHQFMRGQIELRRGPEDGALNGVADQAGGTGAPGGALRGEPRSREDVVRALDAICAYYARNEPSSPVPLLLERCKRLVTMSFLDIVKDMVPDGLTMIQTIAGKRNED